MSLSLSPIVESAVTRIKDLLNSLPTSLTSSQSLSPVRHDRPPFLEAMRHYIQISARHKILVIHRALLAHGGSPHERRRAHAACVQNAQSIIQELEQGQHSGSGNMQSFWTIPYHGLAAAVVLALDWIGIRRDHATQRETVNARRQEVQRARRTLEKLAPTSRIARRGLKVSHCGSAITVLQVLLMVLIGAVRRDARGRDIQSWSETWE